MLHNLRAASETWFGRIVTTLLMGLIVLSFTIWGIGDFFRGFGATHLASVGSTDISADSFRQAYQAQLQRLSAQAKRTVTNDEARSAGLDRKLLNQLIGEAVIDQQTRSLDLAMSDAAITRMTQTDPAFAGIGGAFDKERFAAILRQNNLTERGFLAQQRQTGLRGELVEAVAGGMKAPKALLEALNRARNERRSLDYFVLPESSAGTIAPPTDAELLAYFTPRADNFRAPEYRRLVVLDVRPEAIAKADAVTDADALKHYDEVKVARFTTPEKRNVQQIPFPDEAAAAEASARIKAGASFEDIAKERKLTDKDIELGTVEKGKLIGEIDKVAFGLAQGVVSDPVKNLFGTVLVRVVSITPASVRPFADVSGEIKAELALINARKLAQVLHDKVEDARASGKPLTEAAKAAGLEARQIDAVDASGRDRNGRPALGLDDTKAVLRAAFASDVGVDNDTIETKDRGTIWFEVAGIEPARAQTLEEVKPLVETAWHRDELAKRLTAKASDLVKKLEGGATIADLAKADGDLPVKHVGDAQRTGSQDLPPGVVAALFNTPVGSAGSSAAQDGRLVFRVLDSVVPALDMAASSTKTMEQQVRSGLAGDIFTQYVAQLQAQDGVKINETILRQLTGGEAN